MKLHNLTRNSVIWAVVTVLSAAPSFILALQLEALIMPMLCGVLIVMLVYSVASSTDKVYQWRQSKFYFAKALKITFILRILLSVLVLSAYIVTDNIELFTVIDAYLGIGSLALTQMILGGKATLKTELPVFVATIFQALLMSLALLVVACMIWAMLKLVLRIRGKG
jgi:hypothetical protein